MTRQSKQAKRLVAAREISATRVAGGHGPSATTPKHGKKNAWWQKFRSYKEFVSGVKKAGKRGVVTEEVAEA